ncbi:MAG: sensor histidine kinase, partial [Kordiimonas sp.]
MEADARRRTGYIDLTGWQSDDAVELNGPWQVIRNKIARPDTFDAQYQGETSTLPDFWYLSKGSLAEGKGWPAGFGVTSYRIKVSLPDNVPRLSLQVEEVYSAYEVWVNGVLLTSKGRVTESPEGAASLYAGSLEPLPNAADLEIVFIASNYEHARGGALAAPVLGPSELLTRSRQLDTLYYVALFGILGGLLLFHVAYFVSSFSTGSHWAHLWFALTIILFILRLALLHEIPFEIVGRNFDVNLKAIEFLVVYLMAPAWLAFFASVFPKEFTPKARILLCVPAIPFVFSAAFLSVYTTTKILPYFLVFTFIWATCQLVLATKAWKNGRPGARAIAISTFVYFITAICDSLFHLILIFPVLWWDLELMPLGFIVVSIGYSLALGEKSTSNYKQSLELTHKLSNLNETLEERVLRRTQEANEARLDAEKSAEEKTNFLAAASHDLRQPVNALSIFNQTLRENAKENLHLSKIAEQQQNIIGSMMKMLETMLDATRLEANIQSALMRPVALQPLFDVLYETLLPIAQQNNVKLSVVPSSRAVLADEKHLHRVLSNLAINAINASKDGKVLIGARPNGQNVNLIVADDGRGISHSDQKRIFERFVRIGDAGQGPSGFGLGLSIVTDLCALMEMQIELKSEPNKGTTFRICAYNAELPTPDNVDIEDLIEPPRLERRLAILVVDDNEEVLDAMVQLIRGWGHAARGVQSIETVIETLE